MRIVILLLILFACPMTVRSEGASVRITLHSGNMLDGEILSVRDTAILLARRTHMSEEALQTNLDVVSVVPIRSIRLVVYGGIRHAFFGLCVGLVAGGVVGGVVGHNAWSYRSADAVDTAVNEGLGKLAATIGGVLIGGIGGAIVGLIVGGNTMTGEESLDPSKQGDVGRLQFISRYLDHEPEFLCNVQ